MGELADQRMGGGTDVDGSAEQVGDRDRDASPRVPSVDAVEQVESVHSVQSVHESVHSVHSVGSVTSGVEPPELLPAHEIVADISAADIASDCNCNSPPTLTHPHHTHEDVDEEGDGEGEGDPTPLDDEDEDREEADSAESVMIDAGDFRGVLSEPTYQTLNGRMTPPGFPTSSSYATLTPLQPLPPISTMSDKFSHHYGHHPGNGGFALMQNVNVSMGGMNYPQYDKLGSAMAAAGMNMAVNMGSVNVAIGGGHSHAHVHSHAVHPHSQSNHQQLMNSQNVNVVNVNVASGGHGQQHSVISSSPYHSNGLNSPNNDKSLSPNNGYDYSRDHQRVLGSPQSPSSVNLHSPTSLLPSLNGLPTTPPSAQLPPSPTQPVHVQVSCHQQQQHQQQQRNIVSMHATAVSQAHLTYVTASGLHDVKVATTLTATPQQPVTVLQAITPTPAAIAPSAQTVTIVQAAASANALHNLATTIVSTPVAVVTTAQQQLALQQHHQQQQHQISMKHATGSKNSINSQPSSASSAASNGGDEAEEINTKELAQRISAELKRYSIPQAIFAQRVLCRSQGTLSDLLRNPKPWSKLKSGRETFRRMFKWLEEPEFQRMSALRLAGQSMSNFTSSPHLATPVVFSGICPPELLHSLVLPASSSSSSSFLLIFILIRSFVTVLVCRLALCMKLCSIKHHHLWTLCFILHTYTTELPITRLLFCPGFSFTFKAHFV